MSGSVTVVIGPNGYGKTRYLEETRKSLVDKYGPETVLNVPSEIKLLDEVNDTVDTSQTMEYLMSELIETDEYRRLKAALFEEADRAIAANTARVNGMVEEVFDLNGSARVRCDSRLRPLKMRMSLGHGNCRFLRRQPWTMALPLAKSFAADER